MIAETLHAVFPWLALATWLVIPLYAYTQRGRSFAIFSSIVMALSLLGAVVVHARVPAWAPASLLLPIELGFAYGVCAAALHYAHLVRARMRRRPFRWMVSLPGQSFVAASFMALFWLAALALVRIPLWAFGFETALLWLAPLDLLPYAVATVAFFTSPRPVSEVVRVRLGSEGPAALTRIPVERHRRREPAPLSQRPLRIVQITDPHLGPWQPVHRLRRVVERLAERDPDLVLLTGDFLTMESNATPGALIDALAPLRPIAERCFAAFGNHDHEAPDVVRAAMAANDITLLVDQSAVAHTRAGPVQIVGADFVRNERREHLAALLAAHPRIDDHLRLLLLHDPSAFHAVPDDDVDLVLSGHTHGGQIGLVSFGLDWTVLSGSRWPDHGLFARGSSRLYVHRGTGFYGFPLRIGVPGEASVLELLT